jgi:hypothetical protein
VLSQALLPLRHAELVGHVMPAGGTSQEAAALLLANPALQFLISERPTERRTLSVVTYDARAQLVKTLVVRGAAGYSLGQPDNKCFTSVVDVCASLLTALLGRPVVVVPVGGAGNNNAGTIGARSQTTRSPPPRASAVPATASTPAGQAMLLSPPTPTSAASATAATAVAAAAAATVVNGMKLTRRNSQEAIEKRAWMAQPTFASVKVRRVRVSLSCSSRDRRLSPRT